MLETSVVMVVLLMVVMLAVQVAVYYHERASVTTAAALAADQARVANGSPAEGEQLAERFLAGSAGLRNVSVVVTRDDAAGVVRVHVTADVAQLVPGRAWSVSADSQVPIERLVG